MPRANRVFFPGLIWHVTHRWHQRQFLLRFAIDRRRWRQWLYVAQHRNNLCVLNYIATSNHIHWLVRDQGPGEIATSMQLAGSRTAREYNERKSRHGAFWADLYHATAVQEDEHFARCMTYVDVNMVRAGVVQHPHDWDVTGSSEIQKPWKRKGIINFDALCDLLDAASGDQLARRMRQAADAGIGTTDRDGGWSGGEGIGDEAFLDDLKMLLGPRGTSKKLMVREASGNQLQSIR